MSSNVTWGNIKSLLIFFGPILLPKAISYYRQFRNRSTQAGVQIRALPQSARPGIILLSVLAATFLLRALPIFSTENIFITTQSRLQAPTDVLFNRLASIRTNNALTERDESLRGHFVNLESRLLYLKFGPAVVGDCPFCNAEQPSLYMYYALPALLAPHLLNLFGIALATSPALTGTHGIQWRTFATIASVILCIADIYTLNSYNHQSNARALRLVDLAPFHWTLGIYRCLLLSLVNGLLATVIYLASTNRAFFSLPTTAERVESAVKALTTTRAKMTAMGIVKNTALRDEELRNQTRSYWVHEGRFMREVMEDREVIEGVNDALQNGRVQMDVISRDAETYAENVLASLRAE